MGRLPYLAAALAGFFIACSPSPPLEEPATHASAPADIWLQIDYGDALLVDAPAWTFSNTPGWAAADWAWSGKSYPEVYDLYNDIGVGDDPIGRAALLGANSALDLRFALRKLISCGSLAVRLEGRSASVSSPVTVDVYNPLDSIGAQGSMGHDWVVQVIELDLDSAAVCGAEQALRVSPVGGSSSLALVRMLVTLHDAVWRMP